MKKLILFALIAALLCGVFMYIYLNKVESRVAEAEKEHIIPTEKVLVAARDIPAYTVITEEMLIYKEYPQGYVPEAAARDPEEVINKQADGMIAAGEMVFKTIIGTAEELGSSLSYRVPEGMRAMSISVSVDQGVAGHLTAGDLVDIMQVIVIENKDEEDNAEQNEADQENTEDKKDEVSEIAYRTSVLLGGVKLLATGSSNYTGEDGSLYGNVTLALTPEQCAKLFTAEVLPNSSLYLTLRRRDSEEQSWNNILEFDENMVLTGKEAA